MVGQTVSHFHITGKLGEGGMGVVYRAEDTNLQRPVAMKFLPPHLLEDAESEERLLREARAAASLDHPNVCTVYEIGRHEKHAFFVMAYLEGQTLREKIAHRPMPLAEALNIAIQAGEGIAAAHSKGIVHRDIKSANIMVTPQGVVKVMDFGLAHLSGQSALTQSNTTLGTAAYMSPEQALRQPADQRSDIWSLGVVLYEMLTGVTPFQAEHEAATLFAIVHEELKPATSLRAGLPLTVDRVLGKAMAKNPQVRYQHVDDLLVDLRAVAKGLPVAARPVSRRPRWVLAACGAAAFALAALITAYAFFWRPGRAPADEGQALRAEFTQLTSEPGIEWFPSLSPDGKWLVYAGESGGGRHIFLRGVGGQNPLDLSRGSEEDDDQPAFSPDGERIAFRSSRGGGGIFIMGRTGEAARRVTATGFNPAWSPDGSKLVFNTDRMELYPQNAIATSELWVVEVGSGQTRRLPTDDAVTPNWSPHNQRIAFASRVGRSPQGDVWTIPAGGGTPVQVTNDPARDWNPVWAPDGKHLYFASDRGGNMNLWRVAIDEATGKTRGAPEPVTTPAPYLAHISLSADGKRIAYTAALITANIQQLSLDPAGNTRGEAAWVTTGTRRWSSPDPSPDGEWIAFYSLTQPEGQVFVSRPDGSDLRQLTKDASDRLPRWPPDGRWLSFFSDRSGTLEVWRIRPDGSGLQQLSKCGCGYHVWSPDGTRIAATAGTVGQESRSGLVIFDPNRSWSEQAPEIIPPLNESGDYLLVNSWSPDGRMLAGQVHSENPGIAAYSLATRAYRRIANFGEWPVFLPDSQRVLFVAGGKGFYLADLRSGQVRKIYSVARDVIGPPRLTRDGKKAYFSRRVTESDIWLASLR